MRNWGFREGKQFGQGHKASTKQSWDLNLSPVESFCPSPSFSMDPTLQLRPHNALSTIPTSRPLHLLFLLPGMLSPAWLNRTVCPKTGAVRLLSPPCKSNLALGWPFLSLGHKPILFPFHVQGLACDCHSTGAKE